MDGEEKRQLGVILRGAYNPMEKLYCLIGVHHALEDQPERRSQILKVRNPSFKMQPQSKFFYIQVVSMWCVFLIARFAQLSKMLYSELAACHNFLICCMSAIMSI